MVVNGKVNECGYDCSISFFFFCSTVLCFVDCDGDDADDSDDDNCGDCDDGVDGYDGILCC